MTRILALLASVILAVYAQSAHAQAGELNLLTDLNTPFPPGCLSIDLPSQPRTAESILVNETLFVPSLLSSTRDQQVRLTIWRAACADDDFSVVLVRMRHIGNPDDPNLPFVLVPQVFAEAGANVDFPGHEAQLVRVPGAGNVGASGRFLSTDNTTWMLTVDPVALIGDSFFLPEDYNDSFTVEFNWGSFAPISVPGFVFVLDRFEPELDPPQFDQQVLNGRYTGQWVRPGAERQGLVLQIAELIDRNFVFAIFFTYLDGEPIWVVGNSPAVQVQPGPVTIDPMIVLENGSFITDAQQTPEDQVDIMVAGNIEIEVVDCNNLRVNYDFTGLGKGAGSMDLVRLIRIAGYDCNPWSE